MTLDEAALLVKNLENQGEYFSLPTKPKQTACLGGNFTADELEAIAIIMREIGPFERVPEQK
jgi:hypothetical protein